MTTIGDGGDSDKEKNILKQTSDSLVMKDRFLLFQERGCLV